MLNAVIKGSIAERLASLREVPFVLLWIIELFFALQAFS